MSGMFWRFFSFNAYFVCSDFPR